MAQNNPVIRFITLNGDAGLMTVIRCSITCGYMEIEEDLGSAPGGGANPNGGVYQGLQGNYLDPFTAAPNPALGEEVWLPPSATDPRGDYPISIGDPRHEHGAQNKPIGNGGSGTYTDTRSPVPQTCPAGPGAQAASLGTPVIQLRSNTATATQVRVKEWTA
jgi:hypothetical protein